MKSASVMTRGLAFAKLQANKPWRAVLICLLVAIPYLAHADDEEDWDLFGDFKTEPEQQAEPQSPPQTDIVVLPAEKPPALKAPQHKVLEEIIVTGQKRAENIRDVPISIMALDDRFLAEKGITDMSELSNYVPNVKMSTDNGSGVTLNIRGFSKQSGNAAFDQAVGLLVDGVPYNDNDYFVTGMVDIDRIEVLRGPQGTLLGKNTTAGLLNITTKRPDGERGGYLDLQGGEFAQQRIEGAFGGPLLNDVVDFRIAALSDQRDGVIENTTAEHGEDFRSFVAGVPKQLLNRDRQSLRAKIEVPDLFAATWGLQYERSEVSAVGNATELLIVDDDTADYLRGYDPNLDLVPGNFRNSVNDPAFNNRTVSKLVFFTETEFSDWGFKATLGQANIDGLVASSDPTPAPLFGFDITTSKPQYNADFVLTSPTLFNDRIDLTAGFFFEDRTLDTVSNLDLNTGPMAELIVIGNENNPGLTTIPQLPPELQPGLGGDQGRESTRIIFDQDTQNIALYGQLNWHLYERWRVTAGMRLSQEKKNALWDRTFTSPNTVLMTEILGYEEFNTQQSRKENALQPKVALNYKPNDKVNLFIHWARGYRSGGYNQSAGRNDGLSYERESVDEYAFNAKTRLANGAMLLNFGLFRMQLNDFQLLTTGPNDLAPIATNAGKAIAQGAELDLRWLANSWLSVTAALGYNHAKFVDFPFGPCPRDRPNFDGDDDERCDLSGTDLPYAPRWTSNFALNVDHPIGNSLAFIGEVSLESQARSTTGLPGDKRFIQDAYNRWNAQLGIAGDNWSFRVVGKNLSNEAVNRFTAHIPLNNGLVQSLEAPRSVYGQLRMEFGA